VVFQLSPPAISGDPWVETVLHSFLSSEDFPTQLVLDAKGVLGVPGALYGFAGDYTELYQLAPPTVAGGSWVFTSLLKSYFGDLVLSPEGALYVSESNQFVQLTQHGGNWKVTPLFTFTNADPPNSLAVDGKGNVYATTFASFDLGQVIKLSRPAVSGGSWTETVLHTFTGSDGSQPRGILVGPSGNLFGTTQYGGRRGNAGVVWELVLSSGGTYTYRPLWDFAGGADGQWPNHIAFYKGDLYGFTTQQISLGTLYRLTIAPGAIRKTTLLTFVFGDYARSPFGRPFFGTDGSIFGVTENGGTDFEGTFYQFIP
jgi:hypothetical protein